MAKVLLLYVDAGYGHRKVAEAVYQELISRRQNNLELEIFDALKKTNQLFENSYPKMYYQMVVYASWLWSIFFALTNSAFIYPLIAPIRSLWNRLQSTNLRNYIRNGNYDVIVFTHFFPAEVCATEKKKGNIKSTLITIVTDVIPHRVWINSGTDHYWVMSNESAQVLKNCGVGEKQIHVKGIPVSANFTKPVDRAAVRRRLDLSDRLLTILFTSGSFGIGPTEETLHSFSELKEHIQVIVVCGQNKVLFKTLNEKKFPFPVRIFGFVDNMYELMSAADLLIAKPGGATTCESLIKDLPMIITSPIPGQETENANWLSEHKAAFRIDKPSEIKEIVKQIVQNQNLLDSYRSAIKNITKPKATKDLADFILESLTK